jgi:hypothetical protein
VEGSGGVSSSQPPLMVDDGGLAPCPGGSRAHAFSSSIDGSFRIRFLDQKLQVGRSRFIFIPHTYLFGEGQQRQMGRTAVVVDSVARLHLLLAAFAPLRQVDQCILE